MQNIIEIILHVFILKDKYVDLIKNKKKSGTGLSWHISLFN